MWKWPGKNVPVYLRGCGVLAAEGSQDNSGLYLNYLRELFGEREEIHNCSVLTIEIKRCKNWVTVPLTPKNRYASIIAANV